MCVNTAWSQTFNKTYPDPGRISNHNTIVPASNNSDNYVVAGTVSEQNDTSQTDIRLTCFKPDGTIVWEKIYDFSDQDRCYHVNNTDDGYILTGSVQDNNFYESVFLLRVNVVGAVQNFRIYDTAPNPIFKGKNHGLSVIPTSSGGFAVAGFAIDGFYYYHKTAPKEGFFIQTDATLNPIGNIAKIGLAIAEHIVEVPGTGFFITGTADEYVQYSNHVIAVMLDYNGNLLWQKVFDFKMVSEAGAHTVYDPSTRHLYLLSNIEQEQNFAITKIDLNGNIKSALDFKQTNSSYRIFGFDLKISPTDTANLIVTGYFNTPTGILNTYEASLFSAEFNKSTGAYSWRKTWPTMGWQYGYSVFTSTAGMFAPMLIQNMPYAYTPAIAALTSNNNNLVMATYRPQQYHKPNNYDLTIVKATVAGDAPCENLNYIFPQAISATPFIRNDLDFKYFPEISNKDTVISELTPQLETYNCSDYICGTPSIQLNSQGCTFNFSSSLTGLGSPVSWQWSFGDGSTSTSPTPVHYYTSSGLMNVCLTLTSITLNGAPCVTTICRSISVNCGGARISNPFLNSDSLQTSVYPVPFTREAHINFTLTAPENVEITAVDLLTNKPVDLLYKKTAVLAGAHDVTWQPDSKLPAGIYLIQIKTSKAIQQHKVMLQR